MGLLDAKFNKEIFRKDHPMVIAQNRQLASIEPVRLAYDAGGYEAGRVLARDPADGLYKKYNDGGASGVATAACILFEAHTTSDFDSNVDTTMGRGIFGGEVFTGVLVGFDAAAAVDLKSRTIIDATGISVTKF